MAQEILLFDRSYTAAATLTQYTAVTLDSNGNAAVPSAGADCVGIVQNGDGAVPGTSGTVSSGRPAEVRVHGVSKMLVGASSVSAGDKIKVDASGQAVTWTTGNYCIGKAESGGASGTFISVLVQPTGKT